MATVINSDGLGRWYAAVQNRANAPAKVVCIGDSITEGTGSGTWGFQWEQLLQARLRGAYPVAGVTTPGIGYIPALTAFAPTPPVTTSGTPATGFTDHGLGIKRYKVNNTQFVEWSATTCDAVRVHYAKDTANGDLIVAVDGVDKVTLAGNGAAQDGLVWDSTGLSAGSHTVRVRGAGAFGGALAAVEFFNGDKSSGIKLYDSGHFGYGSNSFVTAACDTGQWQSLATIAPQLVVYALGVNDWIAARTTSAYLANVDTALAKVATAMGSTPYSVLLVSPYRPAPAAAPDPTVWAAYKAGLLARAVGNVAYMDWQEDWPSLVADGSTSGGLMLEATNPLHPNVAGHDKIANMMLAALSVPDLTVLLDDGTGTFPLDISSKVLASDGFEFSRGRDDWQGAVTAGELSLTLNNSDGRFTPGSTVLGSPSPIKVDQRIQVRETVNGTTYTRFTGYAKAWPVAWPATVTSFAEVRLTATDAQARAERRTLRSMLEEEVLASGPQAYYTLSEESGAVAAGDISGHGEASLLPVMYAGTTYSFGNDLGLPTGVTGLSINNNSSPTGAYFSKAGNGTAAPNPVTWSASSLCMTAVFRQNGFTSGLSSPGVSVHIGSGSGSYAILFDSTGHATFNGCTSPSALTDGLPHVITVQAGNGLSTDLWVDGVKVSTAAVMAVTWDNGFVTIGGQGVTNAVTTWAHFAYGARISDAQVTSIHKAAAATLTETANARVARLAGYAGVTLGTLDTSATTVATQSTAGSSAQDAIQAVTDTELGVTYIDGTGALTFHNRNRVVAKTTPDLTLTSQWVTPDVNPVLDDQQIVNYVEGTTQGTGATITTPATSSSQTAHGRYPASQTYLTQTDSETNDRISWTVFKFAEPTTRYGTLTINLYGMTAAQREQVIKAVDIDCWLQVTGLASQNPDGTTADVIVQGFREVRTADTWAIVCNVVSRSLYTGVFILDSSVLDGTDVLYV